MKFSYEIQLTLLQGKMRKPFLRSLSLEIACIRELPEFEEELVCGPLF